MDRRAIHVNFLKKIQNYKKLKKKINGEASMKSGTIDSKGKIRERKRSERISSLTFFFVIVFGDPLTLLHPSIPLAERLEQSIELSEIARGCRRGTGITTGRSTRRLIMYSRWF